MGELLLELFSEEIPAGYQRRAVDDLVRLVRDRLAAADLPAASLQGYVTPRRLTVIADGIPATQPDRTEERRGPRVGAPQPAIDGFLRSAGLAAIAQCEVRDTGRGEFYFAVLHRPGRAAAAVLPELVREAVAALPWPKSMRYPAAPLRWVRPLGSVLCLFDGAAVPLEFGEVPVGSTTRGHRWLAPGEISVASAADYRAALESAHVVLDPQRRRERIAAALDCAAAAAGVKVKPDPALLDEVTGLVEWPVVLLGRIDADFVRPLPEGLPPEVLATAMRTHQKYFTCLNPDGAPAPYFLFVANNAAPDGGAAIVAGNERVLRARLSDARFFWDQDRRVPLEARVPALADRVFHARLGNMLDKVGRMEKLAEHLVGHVPGADRARTRHAVLLCKADLSTGMVGEFPELQGVMGRYYALADGEDPRIADAIADHYRPLGPNDACPSAPDSIVVALADKIDSIVAFFRAGERPTGSGDPYALRRAAQGVIRLILENHLRLDLSELVDAAELGFAVERVLEALSGDAPRAPVPSTLKAEVLDFIVDRLKVHLRDKGSRHDLIAAVFALDEYDLVRLLARVAALSSFLATEDGEDLLVAYRRATNIVGIETRKGGWDQGNIDTALFRQPQEWALLQSLEGVSGDAGDALRREDFQEAMAALARLRRPVDAFFDKVTVNADDPALRQNRLRLLSRIRAVINQVADFSQIEG